MTDMRDIYWLAGLLEGEGSFSHGSVYNQPTIAVTMYDVDVIERALRVLKPREYRKNGNRPTFHQNKNRRLPLCSARISGRRAVGWMMTLYPLMGTRRKARIRNLLAAWLISEN